MVKNQTDFNNKIKQFSAGIAGLGGLGSNAAVSLARTGIGKLVLVDYDKIDKTNLNRQYYFLDQIGKNKTEAIAENIKKINPETQVITYNKKLKKNSMSVFFKDVDIVIEALDDAKTKTIFIEEILENLPKKYLIAASGVAGYGSNERIKIKKLGNLFIIYDKEAKSSDDDILIGPRVALIANMQANLAVELLLDKVKK